MHLICPSRFRCIATKFEEIVSCNHQNHSRQLQADTKTMFNMHEHNIRKYKLVSKMRSSFSNTRLWQEDSQRTRIGGIAIQSRTAVHSTGHTTGTVSVLAKPHVVRKCQRKVLRMKRTRSAIEIREQERRFRCRIVCRSQTNLHP